MLTAMTLGTLVAALIGSLLIGVGLAGGKIVWPLPRLSLWLVLGLVILFWSLAFQMRFQRL